MPIAADQQVPHVKMGPGEVPDIREFPRMIYHVIEGTKIVQTQEELDAALEAGWSKTPIQLNELAILDTKIAETKAMLKDLEAKRKVMAAQKQREQEAHEKCRA